MRRFVWFTPMTQRWFDHAVKVGLSPGFVARYRVLVGAKRWALVFVREVREDTE